MWTLQQEVILILFPPLSSGKVPCYNIHRGSTSIIKYAGLQVSQAGEVQQGGLGA